VEKVTSVSFQVSMLVWVLAVSLHSIASGRLQAAGLAMQVLHEFTQEFPTSLIQGSDDNFYGTTLYGGSASAGMVFKMTPGCTLNVLASFDYTNGANPTGIIQGNDGSFYGSAGFEDGPGSVFKLSLDSKLTKLVAIDGTNGWWLNGVIQGMDGNIYGTNLRGGPRDSGTAFRLTPAGALTTLAVFGGTNGANPTCLLEGKNGFFYGATTSGEIFRMKANGLLSPVAFPGKTNGLGFTISLVLGGDGDLYGITGNGGSGDCPPVPTSFGCGIGFRLASDATLTQVAQFGSGNGSVPFGLVAGEDGSFYGFTQRGGDNGAGTIFRMRTDGTLTTLYSFSGLIVNSFRTKLIQGHDGNLYGILNTLNGSTSAPGGTVFRIVAPPMMKTGLGRDGTVTLRWTSFPGAAYQVEYSSSLNGTNWTASSTTVMATNEVTSIIWEPEARTERYYRIRLLP
jgi:uncharacterized repeat protein (TIGR03803 family)